MGGRDGPPASAPEPAELRAPGLLLIGAGGRNLGKTEFAATLVRRLAGQTELSAAKVTTVHGSGQGCPRGGAGCGVCSALGALPYEIVEEQERSPAKDTGRLLEAGARRVLWLRARLDGLRSGARALFERMGPEAHWVCESNSLRRHVEPGLFLLIRGAGSSGIKASAAAVASCADAEVLSDGRSFVPAPEEFIPLPGPAWGWRRPATAVILAGGGSTRMGRDKALLPLEGRTLIERLVARLDPFFQEILVSAADAERYAFLGRKIVVDPKPGQGPLMGVACGLAAAAYETVFFLPCDVPDLPVSLFLRLLRVARDAEGAVPVDSRGLLEPLCAVYRKSVLGRLEAGLAGGERKIIRLFPGLDLRLVPLSEGLELTNLNTREDYERRLGRA